MKVSVVIPTYNERANIAPLVKEISSVFKENRINGRIIIVDDNSPDGTGKIADELSKKYPVLAIHRHKDKGYGNSVKEGLRKAIKLNFDAAITMDSDFSHNPKIIPKMIEEINKGYDVVVGSRRVEGGKIIGWNWWRHLCSKGASQFSRLLLGLKTKDVTSGFRAYKISSLKKIPFDRIKSNGYAFLEELLYFMESSKLKIKETPITFVDRKHGKSKLSKKEIIKFFATMLNLKLKRHRRFIKFAAVGALGTLVNMFFLWFFKSEIQLPLEIAGIFAIELSIINNFLFNNFWTFKDRINKSKFYAKFFKYHISVLLGVCMNYSVLLLLTNFGLFYLLSNLIGIIIAMFSNYLLSSRWAWKNEK